MVLPTSGTHDAQMLYLDRNGYGAYLEGPLRPAVQINRGVFNSNVEGNITSSIKSRLKIQVADQNFMEGRRDGMLHMLFIDPTTKNYANNGNTFSYKIHYGQESGQTMIPDLV